MGVRTQRSKRSRVEKEEEDELDEDVCTGPPDLSYLQSSVSGSDRSRQKTDSAGAAKSTCINLSHPQMR